MAKSKAFNIYRVLEMFIKSPRKEQDRIIEGFRKQAILDGDIKICENCKKEFS